jgi:hypothetical protein
MDDYLDMDEDKVQNNRNAFNESFDITMKNYIYLWKDFEKNMGKQWFEREFGQFMKMYFVGKLQVIIDSSNYSNLSSININYPSNLIVPELSSIPYSKKYNFSFISGKDMIKHIWSNIDNVFSEQKVNNLWNYDESLWELNFL